MRFIPLRTAVIAGTCAAALSFVALPAHAAVPFSDLGSSSSTPGTTTDDGSGTTDDPGTTTDDGTTATDDSGTDATDDDGTDVSDDDGSDVSDDDGDDSTSAPVDDSSKPAEAGKPKQHFADTVFTPKEIRKKGLEVRYTGLTPGKTYQPYYSTGQSGGELGDVLTADKKGRIRFTYRFDKTEKKQFASLGAVYTVGLRGQDTDLDLTQTVTVKYDSDLTWHPAERHGKKVVLSVSVDKDDASGRSSDWRKVDVDFQQQVDGRWVTVKTVKTNARGVARATIKAGVSVWRAVLDSSATVVGATSKGHRK